MPPAVRIAATGDGAVLTLSPGSMPFSKSETPLADRNNCRARLLAIVVLRFPVVVMPARAGLERLELAGRD
jgi:hypothetical protein